MSTIHPRVTIAQAQQSPPVTPPSVQDFAYGGVTVAALVWIAKQAVGWIVNKDKAESDLTRTLIDDLRTIQQTQATATRTGLDGLSASVDRLRNSVSEEVQLTLKDQTRIYIQLSENLVELKRETAALHRRMDYLVDNLNSVPMIAPNSVAKSSEPSREN
ncbi:hypothetical protein BST81_03515 [Leptolyngbya sp. 'hensonii']|uniref:hypothetical protein n=1 Tax=Leptolyngbya sp. 'hensonii' TaxID=1922337 RepID=UPI00094FFBF8|nr:hypothetical protein [Leptolyngbya sp. 'hensonii']OLP19811.1 hypothetical protein BST81_03515 [Leptolyngbya sp. 'hensonii']